jgi:hypothetical protein
MSAQLNWRGSTPFGELSGLFPLTSAADFDSQLVNFSTGSQKPVSELVYHGMVVTDKYIFRTISVRVNLLGEMLHEDFPPRGSRRITGGRRAYHYKNHLSQGGVVF